MIDNDEEIYSDDTEEDDSRLDENGNPIEPITVWVNSGFGHGSYSCTIQSNGVITLPDGLVRELNMEDSDKLEWHFEKNDGTLYVSVLRDDWEAPEWLDPNESVN